MLVEAEEEGDYSANEHRQTCSKSDPSREESCERHVIKVQFQQSIEVSLMPREEVNCNGFTDPHQLMLPLYMSMKIKRIRNGACIVS